MAESGLISVKRVRMQGTAVGTPEIAAQLAIYLAGLANVYIFDDPEFTKQLAYGIGKERGVLQRLRGPRLPESLENPNRHAIEISDRVQDDIANVARDWSLAKDVRKRWKASFATRSTTRRTCAGSAMASVRATSATTTASCGASRAVRSVSYSS